VEVRAKGTKINPRSIERRGRLLRDDTSASSWFVIQLDIGIRYGKPQLK